MNEQNIHLQSSASVHLDIQEPRFETNFYLEVVENGNSIASSTLYSYYSKIENISNTDILTERIIKIDI